MYRTLEDLEGRYVIVPPGEGVSLATLGVPPYSPPDPAWEDEYPASSGPDGLGPADVRRFAVMPPAAPDMEAPGISFVDLVRAISPAAEPGAWREDNRASFWTLDDQRSLSGTSFDDFVRTIDPVSTPDIWREDSPWDAGREESGGYSVPHDSRAAATVVQATHPSADAAVWREGNVAPFWRNDDSYAPSGRISFDDLVRTIASTADPDMPRGGSTPLNVGHSWDGGPTNVSERYAVPHDRMRPDPRGTFEIPGLPEDAGAWRWSEATPVDAEILLAELESEGKGRILDLLREPATAILRALIRGRLGGKSSPRTDPQPGQPKSGASKPVEQPSQPTSKSSARGGQVDPVSTATRDILTPGGRPVGTRDRGASDEVRTTTSSHFDEIYSRLKSGSKPAEPSRGYEGSAFERSDGIIIGERVSKQHGRTLEVLRSTDPLLPQGFKVHQK